MVYLESLRDLSDPRIKVGERSEDLRTVRTAPGQRLQKIPLDPQGFANTVGRHEADYGAAGSIPSLRM